MELEKVAQVATVLAAVVAVLEFLRRKRIKREEITYDERSDPSLDDESFSETLKMYRLCLRADAFVETFAFLWALPGIPIGLIVWNQTESFWGGLAAGGVLAGFLSLFGSHVATSLVYPWLKFRAHMWVGSRNRLRRLDYMLEDHSWNSEPLKEALEKVLDPIRRILNSG